MKNSDFRPFAEHFRKKLNALFKKFNKEHLADKDIASDFEKNNPINALHAGDILGFYFVRYNKLRVFHKLTQKQVGKLLQLIENDPQRNSKEQPLDPLSDGENEEWEYEYVRQAIRSYNK